MVARYTFRLCVFLLVICRLLNRGSSPNTSYPCPGLRHWLSFVYQKCGLVRIEKSYSWRACGRRPLTSSCFHHGLNVCLLICGDIQINPGPVIRHPCSICDKPVRCIDAALLCDGCNQWAHCRCSGVSELLYVEYQACSQFDWQCSKCLNAQLPFFDCSLSDTSIQPSVLNCNKGNLFPIKHFAGLTIAHLNVRSLLSCYHEIEITLYNHSIDVLTLSETWLDDSVNDCEVCPSLYSVIRYDRNRRGGGVAILVSNRVPFYICRNTGCGPIETLWLVLFPDSLRRKMYLCCAYRPPSCSTFFESLITETEIIISSSMNTRLAILGDLNCDVFSTDLPHTKSLLAYCDQFNLHNIIDSLLELLKRHHPCWICF